MAIHTFLYVYGQMVSDILFCFQLYGFSGFLRIRSNRNPYTMQYCINLIFFTMKTQNKKNPVIVVKHVETTINPVNYAPETTENDTIESIISEIPELGVSMDATAKQKIVRTEKTERTGICRRLVEFITPLIAESKYTKKQIFAMASEKIENFEKHYVTANTLVIDSRNVKYNKFSKLVVRNDNTNVLSFVD